jgi:hypothetical protein
MFNRNLELVERFLSLINRAGTELEWLPLLSAEVGYELLIAKEEPLAYSLQGKSQVHSYLGLLPLTYEILHEGRRQVFAAEDRVIASGSERAHVVRLDQAVDTEWLCMFQFEGSLIKTISMSIYRWKVLTASELTYTDVLHLDRCTEVPPLPSAYTS